MPHRHRHIAGAGPNGADALDFPQDVAQIFYAVRLFHDAHQQHIAVGVQRPQVGGIVILGGRQSPIARGDAIPPAALALRLEVRRPRHLRIARRHHRRLRVLNGVQMGQHQAVNPGVQRLFQHPLVAFAEVGRNPHERRRAGLQRAALGHLAARQQKLQRNPQRVEAEPLMLHFDDGHIVVGVGHESQVVQIAVPHQPGAENRLPLFQKLDNLVVAHHQNPPPVIAFPVIAFRENLAPQSARRKRDYAQPPGQMSTAPPCQPNPPPNPFILSWSQDKRMYGFTLRIPQQGRGARPCAPTPSGAYANIRRAAGGCVSRCVD